MIGQRNPARRNTMPTSLFDADFQTIFDAAKNAAGQANGPFPSPPDWRDQWIYFLMVDRFNNKTALPRHQPFDDPSFSDFQGGEFSGVADKLPYLKKLGVGAIWLSPVLKNLKFDPIYHGYGIHNFLRAEPRFADDPEKADDELRALVDAAHAHGIYIIFDIVLNHTGSIFTYLCDANDENCKRTSGSESRFSDNIRTVRWRDGDGVPRPQFGSVESIPTPSLDSVVWPKELQKDDFFRRQGGTKSGPDDTIGDFASLKQMLTADADLQRFLIRAYQYVIARYDVDGFRIDTLRYLKGDLPRLFGNSIREFAEQIGKKNFFTFEEVFDAQAEQDIARFIGRNTNDKSELVGVDAAVDYPLFNALKAVAKGFSAPTALVNMFHFRKQIERDVLSSHGEATRFFVTFLDNHDVKERFRFIEPGQEHKFDDQVTLAFGCLYALPGIPCIYYGTELGLSGRGNDEAVREAIWGRPGGFDENNFFYKEFRKIALVRANRPSLRYGRFYFRPISGNSHDFAISSLQPGVLAFSRILNDEETVIVANADGRFGASLDIIVDARLNQPNTQYRVLYSNKATPAAPSAVRQTGTVTVQEVDCGIGNGPLQIIHVVLQPYEVQLLGR
jgi:glycosidase